jgi:hypothetical protein
VLLSMYVVINCAVDTVNQRGEKSIFRCYSSFILSSRHGASSGCEWRRRPPVMRVAANILNSAVAVSRQGVAFHLGAWAGG